jgi:hypothetical protein
MRPRWTLRRAEDGETRDADGRMKVKILRPMNNTDKGNHVCDWQWQGLKKDLMETNCQL